MKIQDVYTDWSTTYDADRNLTRDLDERVTREVLAAYASRSIIELGCGTGKNTAFLAQIGARVRAFDFSAGMLAQARAKVQAEHVTFTLTDIAQPWPCPDADADLLVCNLVLEHIQDLSFVVGEAARVLRPGGHFFVSELHPFRQYAGKQAEFQRGDQLIQVPAFVHHISEFLDVASQHGFALMRLQEWWHETDHNQPPRLVTFVFQQSRKNITENITENI